MARPVQLAPGSLALVLSRLEAAGPAREAGGRAVFRAFRRANARCSWDASRLVFQGWLRRAVLLVRAPRACLRALREAWRRRALRPPRGFRIRAVGDVFPVQMNPIAQSQFVPLVEVLCSAVSDMNAAQITVTQESLSGHLMKHYPGIKIPSPDVLYTALGALIRERKIYHTEGGYFVVTPHTYFSTETWTADTNGALSDDGCLAPASAACGASRETCAQLAKDSPAQGPHCPSCQCFPGMCTREIEPPPAAVTAPRKGQKDQAVSASEETDTCVRSKTLPFARDKEKNRRFGLGFLWRSMSRKDKLKPGHCSFSAQFPPEEWPVRDEDNLDNIPRDVEHEIIKRINPVLTVDNLMKHTVLMQRCQEQKKYQSQGTSTDRLTAMPQCRSQEGARKRQGHSVKHRDPRGHPHRDKVSSQASSRQPASLKLAKDLQVPAAQPVSRVTTSPTKEAQNLCGGENPAVLGSHWIYKKRISNPFQGLSHRGNLITRGHNLQKTSDPKPSEIPAAAKPFPRPRSPDLSGLSDGEAPQLRAGEAPQPCARQHHDPQEVGSTYMNGRPVHLASKDFGGGRISCPPRGGSQGHRERDTFHCKATPQVWRTQPACFDQPVEAKETQQKLPSRCSPSSDPTPAHRSMDKTILQFQSLNLFHHPVGAHCVKQGERQDHPEELFGKAEVASLDNKGFCADDKALHQGALEGDDGACSSLYLEEDDSSENDLGQALPEDSGCYPLAEPNCQGDGLQPPTRTGDRGQALESGTLFSFNPKDELSVSKRARGRGPGAHRRPSARTAHRGAAIRPGAEDHAGEKPASPHQNPKNQDMRRHFADKLKPLGTSHVPGLAWDVRAEHSHLKGTENHGPARDSGIDSPRTQSLTSNNSAVLDGFKRRQNFLQTFEGTKSSQTLISNPLLQLTPVFNV